MATTSDKHSIEEDEEEEEEEEEEGEDVPSKHVETE